MTEDMLLERQAALAALGDCTSTQCLRQSVPRCFVLAAGQQMIT